MDSRQAKKKMSKLVQFILLFSFIFTVNIQTASAVEYSASFKNADISEFVNIVGKNLKKTIILDPAVRGKVNVRSYDLLSEDQYYQFFLSVLEVYGFAAIDTGSGIIKVIKAKEVFSLIMKSTYDFAEPGFILIDRVNKENNTS